MGIVYDDAVLIKEAAEGSKDHTMITVNCPDKTGLGCDLCRIILLFGLSITRGDVSTDGKWCYLVFWVVGKPTAGWNLLKKRLLEVCPSCTPAASEIYYYKPEFQDPKPPYVFLVKFWCSYDRKGLLHDVTKGLYELELTIRRVKVTTTPDGKVMDLFFVTDSRGLLQTKERQEETINHLRAVLGAAMMSCEIELAGSEVTARLESLLPSSITEDMFSLEMPERNSSGVLPADSVSLLVDNTLSPSHTIIQIRCQDHKGLIYDIMRTLKDYDIDDGRIGQVASRPFTRSQAKLLQLVHLGIAFGGMEETHGDGWKTYTLSTWKEDDMGALGSTLEGQQNGAKMVEQGGAPPSILGAPPGCC